MAKAASDGVSRADLGGVGISAPGPVDPRAGVVLEPPNLGADFRDVPLAAEVASALGIPTRLDRDTNVALLGEQAFGAARHEGDAVYLTVSTGVGGAILSRGRLVHGPDGLAGELGHLTVDLDGPTCGCGGRGHVEAIASGTALARDAGAAANDGRSPYLAAQAAQHELSARDVTAGAEAGDPTCVALLDRAVNAIGAACASIANALNPHLIVIGGAIGLALGERLRQPVRDAIAMNVFPVIGRHVRVVPPELGDDVSVAGAWPLVHWQSGEPDFERRVPTTDRTTPGLQIAASAPKEVTIS
jgi:glucokinase